VIEEFWWILTRASGFVAWALLVTSIVWGMLLATRVLKPHDKPGWLMDLHRWLGTLTIGFVGLHLVALVADNYVRFTLTDLLVPFASDYARTGVALGVIGLYGLVAVYGSSLAMRRMPTVWWRGIHLASYLTVLAVSWHAVISGTDITKPGYAVAAVVLSATPILIFAIPTRVVCGHPRIQRQRHSHLTAFPYFRISVFPDSWRYV
jgi:predicted ferric reductase